MQLSMASYRSTDGWSVPLATSADGPRTLVLAFGPADLADDPRPLAGLAAAFPRSTLVGCSTSGCILGDQLSDDALVVAVARFDHTDLATASAAVDGPGGSFEAGRAVAARLASPGLRAVLVYADGLRANGSDLVRGINDGLAGLSHPVTVTGGMAADRERYRRTWSAVGVGPAGGVPQAGRVVAVGLSGDRLRVSHGSAGGWDPLGPERQITRAVGRVVHEIDGQPALALYKRYLGEQAAGLPMTALRFPMSVRPDRDAPHRLIRAVLAVDEADQSLTFGGEVPQGWCGQLLRGTVDRLVGGAADAADTLKAGRPDDLGPALTLAVSCSGRRIVMGERTEEELEAVGAQVGFYSYGEICPHSADGRPTPADAHWGAAELHNQTMTLTRLAEAA